MEEGNGRSSILIILVVVALIAALIGVGLVIYNMVTFGNPLGRNGTSVSSGSQLDTVTEPIKTDTSQKYNFNFPVVAAAENVDPTDTPTNTPTYQKDGLVTKQYKEIAEEAIIPKSIKATNLDKVIIDSIGINAPIIESTDGDAALDQGFWMYPSSYQDNGYGEKIFLCHRRYWGEKHPFSCWYMDRVKIGEKIKLTTKEGETITYSVISQTVHPETDLSILKTANIDLIKIITCTPLGSSSHRLVTIAKRVS